MLYVATMSMSNKRVYGILCVLSSMCKMFGMVIMTRAYTLLCALLGENITHFAGPLASTLS